MLLFSHSYSNVFDSCASNDWLLAVRSLLIDCMMYNIYLTQVTNVDRLTKSYVLLYTSG